MSCVALFGGSFNPPHVGHFLATAYVRAVAPVDEVWLMPVFRHAFQKSLAPFDARLRMCEAMAGQLPGVLVTSVESEVEGEGRTIDTVAFLRKRYPAHRFHLVIGTDILDETHLWKSFDELIALAPPFVLAREGYPMPETLAPGLEPLGDVRMPKVSSTDIRARLAAGQSVQGLVTREVLAVIAADELYR